MESRERDALYHLILRSMGQLVERDEFDAWVAGDIELAPLFRPVFETVAAQRDTFIRELHQMFPAEVLDRFLAERPDADVGDRAAVVMRIGKELQAMKSLVQSL